MLEPTRGEWRMTFVDLDPDQGGPRADLWCAMTDPRWLSFGTQRRINKALMILHAVTVQRRPMLDDELWALDALYDLVNQHVRSWNLPSADGALDGSDAVAPIWPPLSDMPEKPVAPVHGPKVPKTERASIDALHAEVITVWDQTYELMRKNYRPLDNLFPEHARHLIQGYQERLLDGSKSPARPGLPARPQGITSAA